MCGPQTEEPLHERSSPAVVKALGPTIDFPTCGLWQRDWESPGNPNLNSAGFDYRTSTGLGKQRLLEGTNKNLLAAGPRRKK